MQLCKWTPESTPADLSFKDGAQRRIAKLLEPCWKRLQLFRVSKIRYIQLKLYFIFILLRGFCQLLLLSLWHLHILNVRARPARFTTATTTAKMLSMIARQRSWEPSSAQLSSAQLWGQLSYYVDVGGESWCCGSALGTFYSCAVVVVIVVKQLSQRVGIHTNFMFCQHLVMFLGGKSGRARMSRVKAWLGQVVCSPLA